MSLEGFSRLILERVPAARRFAESRREALGDIDLERIYVENVRAFFGLSYPLARRLLESAARAGALERRIGVLCPHESHIVESFASEESMPESVYCSVCEDEGRESPNHPRSELEQETFYRILPSGR